MLGKKLQAVVIGASGYTGAELIRILLNHPNVDIAALVADRNAGNNIEDIYTHLHGLGLPTLVSIDEVDWKKVDVAFGCLPHGTSHKIVSDIPVSVKVIDLSSDFRFQDTDLYRQWYNIEHTAKELQKEVVYGLTEVYRKQVASARVVACPGCYPTSMLLPLYPLLANNLVEADNIIVDAKTGVTGAGRSAKQQMLFSEVDGGIKAYGVSTHRHTPEMEAQASLAFGGQVCVQFTPQLAPMKRGILSTIYVKLAAGKTIDSLRNALQEQYKGEPFIHIMPEGILPTTHDVCGTNQCRIGLAQGRNPNYVVLVSVIDNLTKGSSGQAVQNMNIMFGFDETKGLDFVPLFP